LRSASGNSPVGEQEITSKNIQALAPSAEVVAETMDAFRNLGFEIGPMGGISFSITAPYRRFRELFQTLAARAPDGGVVVSEAAETPVRELPVENLPKEVARNVVTVTFEEPAQLLV
jgi:hypothetical protein